MYLPNSETGLSASGRVRQRGEVITNRTAGHRLKPFGKADTDSLPVCPPPSWGGFLRGYACVMLLSQVAGAAFSISEKPASLGAPKLSGLQRPGLWRTVSFFWTKSL